jgi:osmoprotectant transport system permease protein
MGFRRGARLWRVELPLAVPLIVAGLRVASVSTIGLVTITGVLGQSQGGLGRFIFDGIQIAFPTEIYLGAVGTIVLSLLADRFFVWLQRVVTPWSAARRVGRATP